MKQATILFRILTMACWLSGTQVMDAVAQKQDSREFGPDNCETIAGKLEAVGNKYPNLRLGESDLIVIAGSPTKFGNRFDKVRIADLTKYLSKFYNIRREQIVYGIGEPPKKFSYLRFYINGSLFLEMTLGPKSRFCTGMGEKLPI